MSNFLKSILSELLKLISSKATRIVITIVLFFQTWLAYLYAKQILRTGLNATPQTNSHLAEPIPPIEYLGFDIILFGLMAMIFLGSLYGASDYKGHSMRTTLLTNGKKSIVLFSKMIAICSFSFVISFVSIYATIATTHATLGNEGLNPVILSSAVWKGIMYGTFSWTALTVLAFIIGFLFRTAIIPLLFLVPQVYNLGDLLAKKFSLGKYLPFALGNGLIATSPNALTGTPEINIVLLLLWIAVPSVATYLRFCKSDLGGSY